MLNLLRSKVLHQIALVAFVAAGAIAGAACGNYFSGWTWGGPVFWLMMHTSDAVGWATIGAVVVGMAIYGMRAVSRPGRSRNAAGTAPASRNRARPPRTDVTSPAASRR